MAIEAALIGLSRHGTPGFRRRKIESFSVKTWQQHMISACADTI